MKKILYEFERFGPEEIHNFSKNSDNIRWRMFFKKNIHKMNSFHKVSLLPKVESFKEAFS